MKKMITNTELNICAIYLPVMLFVNVSLLFVDVSLLFVAVSFALSALEKADSDTFVREHWHKGGKFQIGGLD